MYIYIYTYICVYTYICIYTYVRSERVLGAVEKERRFLLLPAEEAPTPEISVLVKKEAFLVK